MKSRAEYQRNWRKKNPDSIRKTESRRSPESIIKKRAYGREWHKQNADKIKEKRCLYIKRVMSDRAEEWREKRRQAARRVYWADPDKARAKSRKKAGRRRAALAYPVWANRDAIKKFYDECPDGHHVDHIIPLRGKNISGLHVENNLQYLTVSENSRKGNSFP